MRNGLLTLVPFVSAVFFPWPLTALLALVAALFEPLVPLAVGLFVDALYYTPGMEAWPLFTLSGLAMSVIVVFVRSQLRTGTIG